jgi:plastocyanin
LAALSLMAAGAPLWACGAGERAAPAPPELAIAKTEAESGDAQVAAAGRELPQGLRVVVTADGAPAPGVVVTWATSEGTLAPTTDTTDAEGVSTARWTLKFLFAQQVARARLGVAGVAPVTFTAIATPDPNAGNTVLVRNDGGNRFDPAQITVFVGDTVNWFWPEGSDGHNVVPDDGDSPPQSGPLVGYPKFHSFRFAAPGVYHYHCMAHGAPGGVGMSGTVTVLASPGPVP